MVDLDFTRLHSTPVASDPFPHVVVPDFVRPAALSAVLSDLPPIGRRGSYPAESLRLGPAARALVEALEGPEFRQAIAGLFELDLSGAPTMLTLRGWTNERDGHIHRDSPAKRITVLLYLNQEGDAWPAHQGCLRLLRSADDLDAYAVEVPPVNGTLLVFPNSPNSWHGHERFVGTRYSIQLNYMTTDEKARSELRRHRMSAFLKRLTKAA
ncbi:MAG: 2OG-Fe(II) oxygenase [Acetobacteraceae bacterium]|nr:2OG-Fe(II) oxygenase [Acetobacteraceae bacterium]